MKNQPNSQKYQQRQGLEELGVLGKKPVFIYDGRVRDDNRKSDPVETDAEYQDRLAGQESDFQHVKNNTGLNAH